MSLCDCFHEESLRTVVRSSNTKWHVWESILCSRSIVSTGNCMSLRDTKQNDRDTVTLRNRVVYFVLLEHPIENKSIFSNIRANITFWISPWRRDQLILSWYRQGKVYCFQISTCDPVSWMFFWIVVPGAARFYSTRQQQSGRVRTVRQCHDELAHHHSPQLRELQFLSIAARSRSETWNDVSLSDGFHEERFRTVVRSSNTKWHV